MPRRDDIDDIPMLMPDSDEIQAFRAGSNQSSPAQSAATAGTAQPSQREAVIRPTAAVRNTASTTAEPPKRSFGLWMFCLFTLAMVTVGGWWMHHRVVDMEDMLTVSRGELGHARKRIGELEALVVATDVNANKSGTVVQAQVKLIDDRAKERSKFIDSEIDKLWGVAYRTNKPAIAETQKAVANNSVGIKQHTEQMAAQTALVGKQQDLVAGQQKQMAEVAAGNKQLATDVAGQAQNLKGAVGSIQAQEAKLSKAIATLAAVESNNVEASGTINEIQQSLIELRAHSEVLQDDIASLKVSTENSASAVAQVADAVAQQSQLVAEQTQLASQTNSGDLASVSADLAQLQSELSGMQRQVRLATALEQTASELDERLYMTEQSLDSITAFRQDTNRKLDQLANQIRTLQYSE